MKLNKLRTYSSKATNVLKQLDYKYYIGIAIVAIVLVFGLIFILRAPKTAEAEWWNDSWYYRQTITVTNSSGSTQSNMKIKFTINTSSLVTAGKLQSDCDDLRFTEFDGDSLNYWIANGCNTATTEVWVTIPSISNGASSILLYYGNASANAKSSARDALRSCSEISANYGTEVYYVDLDGDGSVSTSQVYCNMTIEGGGWTQIINLDTNDGTDHWWGDTTYWQGTGTEGSAATSLTTGYKGESFTYLDGFDEILSFQHTEGAQVGYGVYDMLSAYQEFSFYELLNIADTDAGTTITTVQQHQAGASGVPLNTERSQTRYGDEFIDSFNTEAIVVNRVKRFNTDGINYMRLATTFDNTSYVHTFSGLGVHHERPTGSYITKVEAAPVTAYCGLVPRYGSDATATGGFCGTVTSYDRDMAIFVRDTNYVTANVTAGSPSSEELGPAPVAYWSFDEGYGTTAHDSTSNSNDGTDQDVGTDIAQNNYLIRFSAYDTWKKIHDSIVSDSETVTEYPDEITTFIKNTDYEMDYTSGLMKILSTGSMVINTYYLIDSTFSNSGTTWQTEDQCISGKCLYFDGADDSYKVNSDSSLSMDSSKSITMQAWVKKIDDINAGMISPGILSHNYANPRLVYSGSAFNFSLYFEDQTRSLSTASNFPPGNWYHAVGIWDGTYFKIYVNGSLAATSPDYSAYTAQSKQAEYYIGRAQSGLGRGLFHGFIDEPKIYPYARTAAQIKTDYNAGLAGVSSPKGVSVAMGGQSDKWLSDGLVGYWKMDENTANTCSGGVNDSCDSSGNGNDGAWNGNASSTAGMFGNGTAFDGTGDYVNLAAGANALDITGDISISLWFYPDNLDSILIDNRYNFSGNEYGYHLQTKADGTVLWSSHDGATNANATCVAHSTGTITADQWNHILVTKAGDSTTVKFYVNGQPAGTDTVAATGIAYSGSYTTRYIGTSSATYPYSGTYEFGSKQYLDGSLDEVRIYNRALSSREVRQLYEWAPGPVGYWDFEEKQGTTAYDKSGNENNGTLTSMDASTDWVLGKYGSALDFDGDNNYVEIPDKSILGVKHVTIEVWLKWNGATADPTTRHYVVDGRSHEYMIYIDEASDLEFTFINSIGSTITLTSGFLPPVGEWAYITATYDGSNAKVYLNGVEKASLPATGDIRSNSGVTRIGLYEGGGNYNTDGQIDEVRIYNYARTQKQILEDMNGGGPASKSPVGYWKFDEGYGTVVKDNSGNGNDGTSFVGTPTWTNDGKFGKALSFNGSDAAGDYVVIPYNSSLNIFADTDWAVSLWAKPTSGSPGTMTVIQGTSHKPRAHVTTTGASFSGYVSAVFKTLVSASGITADQWNHVVFWADGNYNKIYINGVEKGSASYQQLDSPFGELRIGATGWGSENFWGEIDEFKIFNYALTEDEVRQEYNQGKAVVMGSEKNTSSTWDDGGFGGDPPVGYWNFGEGTGTTANDISGNGNTGTLNGMDNNDWVLGKESSWALDFDGSDDRIEIVHDSILSLTNMTLSLWLKTTHTGNDQGILSKYDVHGEWNYQIYSDTNGKINYNIGSDDVWEATLVSNTAINDGQWHHVETVYDSSNMYIYIDGNLDNSVAETRTPGFGGYAAYIGTCTYDDGVTLVYDESDTTFTGQLDEIKYFNYARTPAQIAWDYNKGKPVGHWLLDDGEGTTAIDTSGNSNDGTLTSMDPATDWLDGSDCKFEGCLDFDGDDDYVGPISVDSWIRNVDTVSIAGWYYHDTQTSGAPWGIMTNTDPIGSADGFWWHLDYTDTGPFYLRTEDNVNGEKGTSGTPFVEEDNWYHIVTIVGENNFDIYVDGELYWDWDPSGFSWSNINSDTAYFKIGTSYNNEVDGKLDDVRIYNYALAPSQISEIYNGGLIRFK